jgi:multiple sugar transport system substrate-binding protein
VGSLVTACGSNDSADKASGKKTITVAVGSIGSKGVELLVPAWEKKTGNKVRVVQIPYGDLYQRLSTGFATGAEQFDVAIYAASWLPEFASAGYFKSLEDLYSKKKNWDTVLPSVQKTMYVSGKRYAVPMDGDVMMGFYRKDALENKEYQKRFAAKYGYDLAPPTTWDQYRDIAEFFTGWDWAGSGQKGWGVLEPQKPKDTGQWLFSTHAAAYAANPNVPGQMFFDPETMKPQINNPAWVQALNDWIELKKFAPAQMANLGDGDVLGTWPAGDYALTINWADMGISAQDGANSKVKEKVGYFPVPGSEKVWNVKTNSWDQLSAPSHAPFLAFGGWVGSVASSSKQADTAFDFLDFLDSDENSFAQVTTPGTARNPYREQHFSDVSGWEKAPVKYFDPEPYLTIQRDSMTDPNVQADLRILKAGRYFQSLDQWTQAALSGTMSAKAALDRAAEEWAQITQQVGLEKQKALYREVYGL